MDEEKSKSDGELEKEELNLEGGETEERNDEKDLKFEEVEKYNYNKEKIINNKKKIVILLVGLICIVILAIIFINSVVLKYENLVYPGVSIYNEDISKLSKNQLDKKLYQLKNTINKNIVKIDANKKIYTIKMKDIVIDYNIKYISNNIMNYKKDKNIFEKFIVITTNSKKSFRFEFYIDEEKIKDLEKKIAKDTNMDVKEPQVIIDEPNINYEKGENGLTLQKNYLLKSINNELKSLENSTKDIKISLNYKEEVPKINVKDLKQVNYKISSYTTRYESGTMRGKNVENAAKKIDNLILMPGEEFSYEKYVGPVVISNGYTYAPVISNGELVQGIGGGVCQVSSTLYNTTLKAGMIPTERRNHSKPVHYVPRGLDATLASGSIDYKFKNTYKYPVVINTKSNSGVLTVEFWSDEDTLKGIEYKPVSYVRGNYANTYLYGYDKNGNKVYEKHIDTSIYK